MEKWQKDATVLQNQFVKIKAAAWFSYLQNSLKKVKFK